MGDSYKILKSLSNNVIISEKNDKLYVLIGKGIGFGKKNGEDIIDSKNIEQTFVKIADTEKEAYKNIVKSLDKAILAVTEEIIALAITTLQEELNSHVHVALADHINFAIKRTQEGIDIINPFSSEIEAIYSKEYSLAQRAIDLIHDRLGVKLPESEVGFIALHIYSARVNEKVTKSLKYTSITKDVVEYIKDTLGISIDSKSTEYARFICHLRYAIDRVENEKVLKNIFLPTIKKELKKEFKLAQNVCSYISEIIGKKVPDDEVGYVAIHMERLINR